MFCHLQIFLSKQRSVECKIPSPGKRSSVDPLCPGSALLWGRSSWQLSSSQQERKWLSGAVLNSPSTGRKSGLNEAVSRIGHAVRAHQSSHPLIRLQYFQHPFTGKKQSQGNWSELHLRQNRLMVMGLCRCSQVDRVCVFVCVCWHYHSPHTHAHSTHTHTLPV